MEKERFEEILNSRMSLLSCELADCERLKEKIYKGKTKEAINGYINLFGKDALGEDHE